jgi:transposase
LWMFRLEKNRFAWPKAGAAMSLSVEQFTWLLDGIDIAKVKPHQRLEYDKFS